MNGNDLDRAISDRIAPLVAAAIDGESPDVRDVLAAAVQAGGLAFRFDGSAWVGAVDLGALAGGPSRMVDLARLDVQAVIDLLDEADRAELAGLVAVDVPGDVSTVGATPPLRRRRKPSDDERPDSVA